MFDPASGNGTLHRRPGPSAGRVKGSGRVAVASNDNWPCDGKAGSAKHTANELAQRRSRMIALETLIISTLAGASEEDADVAADFAQYIPPTRRPIRPALITGTPGWHR